MNRNSTIVSWFSGVKKRPGYWASFGWTNVNALFMAPQIACRTLAAIVLIRPRAWWNNKVPLSVMTALLLTGGESVSINSVVAFLALIATVCCVANFGYAINELFDIEEDCRAGRANAAADKGAATMWGIVAISASAAVAVAAAAGGTGAMHLTAGVLLLPLAYSTPPLRLKGRGIPGLGADALAAHVFPALLAIVLVVHQSLPSPSRFTLYAILTWSLCTGLRGILSHQLQSEAKDSKGGLTTVVHTWGHRRIKLLLLAGILPIEVIGFTVVLLQVPMGFLFESTCVAYLLYEGLKLYRAPFPTRVFDWAGQRYVPFVDEGFYKVWAPLALLLDHALVDIRYLLVAPLIVVVFKGRITQEFGEVAETFGVIRKCSDSVVAKLEKSPLSPP